MNVVISRDELTPLTRRLRGEVIGTKLVLVMGRAVGNQIREHLFALNTQRHKYGRNFYAQAARSVTVSAVPAAATISIGQTGFRQRYLGGPITPKNSRYLTIPVAPEAYGMRASEFNDLEFKMVLDPETRRLRPALVRRLSTPIKFIRRKQADGSIKTRVQPGAVQGGEVMFWLVRKVTQRADPTVLPQEDLMRTNAVDAGAKYLDRLRASGNS